MEGKNRPDIAVKHTVERIQKELVNKLDANGDGVVGIEDVIVLAMKMPGVYINRSSFLQNELFKNYSQDVIDKAIATTPAQAGIQPSQIDRIADNVIKYERLKVSGISAALGTPGGWAVVATLPADILQYYGYTLRAVQKLLYLYGFPELDADEQVGLQLDSETLHRIIVCLGVMNSVAGANNALKAMAHALAIGVEKKLLKTALTKGVIFPIVKSVMKWFGINLTKALFAGAVKNAIPVIGGVLGGSLTFFMFEPCCRKLKEALQDTRLSNPNHVMDAEEKRMTDSILRDDVIDAKYTE